MPNDYDETILQQRLQAGLHPADVDLWPAVASGLPAADRRRTHTRRVAALAVCLGAPLLIAAGVYVGKITFVSDPQDMKVQDTPADYQVQYTVHVYTGDDLAPDFEQFLLDWHTDHADELAATAHEEEDGGVTYEETTVLQGTWADLAAQTGLPLLQSTVADAADARLVTSPLAWQYDAYTEDGLPYNLIFRATTDLEDGRTLSCQTIVTMGPRSATERETTRQTTLYNSLLWSTAKDVDWKYEAYRLPTGDSAVIPYCGIARHRTYAFFTHEGIYYEVELNDPQAVTEADLITELKQSLDAFAAE